MSRILAAASVLMAAVMALPVRTSPSDMKDTGWKYSNEECGDNLTWQLGWKSDMTDCTLYIYGTGPMWDFDCYNTPWDQYSYEIEHVVMDNTVESIGDYAFQGLAVLQTVTMPASLTSIGDYAFADCENLKEINIPAGVTEIGKGAFQSADLRRITLPDTVQTIGDCAFENTIWLQSAYIPDSVTAIGTRCFADCASLTDIRIPEQVTTLGDDLFEGDAAWFRTQTDDYIMLGSFLYKYLGTDTEIVIPEGVTRIGQHCFTEQIYYTEEEGTPERVNHEPRSDITAVTLPDSVSELPEGLFSMMAGLETLHLGCNLTAIPTKLCYGCSALSSAAIQDGVLRIGKDAFNKCPALSSVTLPDGLQSIGESAFSGCISLRTLAVPASVTEIGISAFADNPWMKNAGDFVILGDGLLCQYQGKMKIVTVPDGVKTICGCAFYTRDVVAVTLPESVRTICPRSFDCFNLVDITLNDGLTEIPENAVSVSGFFSSIRIPASVTKIHPEAVHTTASYTVIGAKNSAAERFAAEAKASFTESDPLPHGADMTLDPLTDCWSFSNTSATFGSDFYLSDEDRALLEELHCSSEQEWNGSCYGMSVAVILAKNGVFSAGMLNPNAASLHDVAPAKDILSMINFYQLSIDGNWFRMYRQYERTSQRIYRMVCTAQNIPSGASPFLVCFETGSGGSHAVVAYGCETGKWTYEDREWTHRILIYDPNKAGLNDARCIYYDPETLAVCIPHYNFSYQVDHAGQQPYFTIVTEPELLNTKPYPFAERFGRQPASGDVNSDDVCSIADAVAMQQYLLTERTALPDWRAGDFDGNGRLDARDLTMLKQMLFQAA